ncbi:MAG TPA: Zn-dependent alcohol dehydrogenase [Acidimicrobiia bacterium]|nr:Zn-dependent alcohol dehydrogenase [Acidimicrobiia bacterium]
MRSPTVVAMLPVARVAERRTGRIGMRAAVWTGVDEPLSVEEVEPLPPGRGDVVVRIDGSGVCHSDHAVLHGQLPWTPPAILGHEVCGTVVEVGDGVTRVASGDRVISSGLPACGNCFMCVRGEPHLCEQTFVLSASPRAKRADGSAVTTFASLGGFAETMTVPEVSVVPVETDLPAEQLALIGCALTTGVGSVFNTARLPPGATVTVVGLGGIGLSVVQGARIAGASRIFAVDPVAHKRAAAAAQGATDLVDPAVGDPVEQVRAATAGRGTDHAIEAVGRTDTMLTAYRCARRGGVVTMVGMPPADSSITFPALELFLDAKEIRVSNMGSAQIRRDFPRLVALAESGRLDIASMITRRIRLDDVNDAFRAMDAGEEIRTVIV